MDVQVLECRMNRFHSANALVGMNLFYLGPYGIRVDLGSGAVGCESTSEPPCLGSGPSLLNPNVTLIHFSKLLGTAEGLRKTTK
jgi:hypothetical protein